MPSKELIVSVSDAVSDGEAIAAVSQELAETLAKAVKLQQALATLLLKRFVAEAQQTRKELANEG